MSLDFPASPTEGQTYAAEGAVYRYTSGRWMLLAQNGELARDAFMHGDVTAGWWVTGDKLECWGITPIPANSNPATIPFPREFKALPSLTASTRSNSPNFTSSLAAVNEFTIRVWDYNGDVVSGARTVDWYAVGEALDADKRPVP